MKLIARFGNRHHAPEHSRIALLSAWTSGADALEIALQPTREGQLVLASEPTTDARTGRPGRIEALTLTELLTRDFDTSVGFPDSGGYRYRNTAEHPGWHVPYEVFQDVVDELPPEVELVVHLPAPSDRPTEYTHEVVETLASRCRLRTAVLCSTNSELLASVRAMPGEPRTCLVAEGLATDRLAETLRASRADGLLVGDDIVLAADGTMTPAGAALTAVVEENRLRVGAILRPTAPMKIPSESLLEHAASAPVVWGVSTDSVLRVGGFAGTGPVLIDETFAGREVDTRHFAFGYAKAHRNTRVWQDDGVRLAIEPYRGGLGPFDVPLPRTFGERVSRLEERSLYALKDWPYYSGGGLGVRKGIVGDFVAEVDYTVERVAQATMLEMAAVNVDPGAHRAGPPRSIRDQDSFYDPHGSPPFVGTEHDEDDGYRINWNLGTEYENNQYGTPCGNGRALGARLRLERRGAYFSAYYRNAETPDWICVGAVRNDSLNPRVFLRCVAKRWRQERADGSGWQEVIPNRWWFGNLYVRLSQKEG